MERVYVRLSPGISVEDAARKIAEMGETVARELPKGNAELVLTNVGSPNNARSAMTSPNNGPHMGFIRLALADEEKRTLSQREIADKMREILNRRYPGVEFLQWPGGLVASVFANGYIAPLVVEVRGDNLAELDAQARAVAEVARTVPGVRDVRVSLETNYPEVRVETLRDEAGLVGVTARSAAQTTLEATLGNINTPSVWIDPSNGQSYYVVTSYDGKAVADPNALAQIPVRMSDEGRAVPLGAYGTIRRSVGPIAIERNQLQRAAHVLMQTERRDIGSSAKTLEHRT
jgi:multidrug efflux pump subunit AcrB